MVPRRGEQKRISKVPGKEHRFLGWPEASGRYGFLDEPTCQVVQQAPLFYLYMQACPPCGAFEKRLMALEVHHARCFT
jgi:hypothetical protein